MYRNFVFDLGGVVVNYDPKGFLLNRFYSEGTEAKLYDAVFGSDEWKQLDKGTLTWREAAGIFMARAREMDLVFEMTAVLEEWTEMLSTRKATITLLQLFKKKGFQLYYLSNMCSEVHSMLQKRSFWPLFDGGILSYEVGMNKPDIDMYRALLRKYALLPHETIFTDDNKDNANAAFEAGIAGIHFKNLKDFCKMLVTYGVDV